VSYSTAICRDGTLRFAASARDKQARESWIVVAETEGEAWVELCRQLGFEMEE
jgi:hypothetical protein